METMRTRLLSCHNCPMKCGASIAVDKRFCSYMMKCFSKLTYTMGAYSDLDFGLRIAQKATEHGIDAFSGPQTMAFAVELYEAGILTDKDMPGLPSRQRGPLLLAAGQDRAPGRDRRRSGRRHLLGGQRPSGRAQRSTPTTTSRRPSSFPSSSACSTPSTSSCTAPARRSTSPRSKGITPRPPSPPGRSGRPSWRIGLTSPMRGSRSGSWSGSLRGDKSIPNYPRVGPHL